ncbi:hypothetical protein M422DRAFT_256940 [Sphaerobolus stellatus SS14]|uniref:CoA carboxyltransferase C-terminal domain-containing protein n=1 Tax=Sphaerobolus stellatus (strain SS14) TaxID=990650 RepID=A0A0C9VFA2_SPHS4|nr:hypothetical protein M422DRAFT_256940 [Sphaerobolus stellatus SS14]
MLTVPHCSSNPHCTPQVHTTETLRQAVPSVFKEAITVLTAALPNSITDTLIPTSMSVTTAPSLLSFASPASHGLLMISSHAPVHLLVLEFLLLNETLAALEVYACCTYHAYQLLSIDYEGDGLDEGDSPNVVTWRFKLGQSASPPSTPQFDRLVNPNLSTGVLLHLFPNMEALCRGFDKVVSRIPAWDIENHACRHGGNTERPNVFSFALRIFEEEDDMPEAQWRKAFTYFINSKKETIIAHGIHCATLMICRKGQYPYFVTLREIVTLREMATSWAEEEAIRNVEPALAYQLELSHLSNYKLTPCFVEDCQIHIYHAIAKENPLDSRFFIRALIRPGLSMTDRLVESILDALEVVSAKHRGADCNHIGMNFVYNLNVTFDQVMDAVSGFLERHGKRLWRLHITGAEVHCKLEDNDGSVTPIRVVIENVSGFIVNFNAYQEISTDKGTTILKSIGEKGALHLQPVHHPFTTKGSLQPRRYQAHLIGTTYMYDFLDLFSKALYNLWLKARAANPSLVQPKVFLVSKELVLDENDELQEVDRASGNNTRSMVTWVFTLYTPEKIDSSILPLNMLARSAYHVFICLPTPVTNPTSFEQRIMEAGQVWYPNSAYKTAQAIFDFNREGLLLIIFANWRGFSGGRQDMYDEILKQGSKIVDGLSTYKRLVFIYIVLYGELRGGAWVVLDPLINSEHMEMYTDVESRAGVLEPKGVVEIKLHRDKQLSLMEHLDSRYGKYKRLTGPIAPRRASMPPKLPD